MKKLFGLLLILLISTAIFAQVEEEEGNFVPQDDTTFVDTLNKNLIGLNVYPAFGIFGSGPMPASKISMQYKHMYDRMNIRASLNFININRENNFVDIVTMESDEVISDGDTLQVDSLVLRQYFYNIYTYDFRIGAEAAFPGKNHRFYIGGGLIGGYHYTGEYYYHYKREFVGYPVNYINVTPFGLGPEAVGFREIDFLKLGVDLTVGVDINISPNCVISIQYAPEFVYYKNMKENIVDPDNYYVNQVDSEFVFVPDYIDVIVSIRF
ncbi:MAG: hypothetical protein C0596_05500 [Marinilabiliales bacterium]|nr:MAG: hypothetical protein C0596_05500 [Marinilabiliales bacterium]